MRVLVQSGLYSSLSECLRTAIWDYLHVQERTDDQGNLIPVLIPSIFQEEHVKDFIGPTSSITGKFPISMIHQIDCLVRELPEYKNRSEFFRAALINFLVSDSKIFSPFLLEN